MGHWRPSARSWVLEFPAGFVVAGEEGGGFRGRIHQLTGRGIDGDGSADALGDVAELNQLCADAGVADGGVEW